MRFPPGRDNPVVDVRIGVYGKGPGKWSLKEAKDEWSAIKIWSKTHNRDPRDRKREQKKALVQRTTSPTFEQASESYLSEWTSANKQGKKEYRNLLWNQILPELHHSEGRYPAGVAATTVTRLARTDEKAASALSLDLASKIVTMLDCGIEDLLEVVEH
jgi:DNA-binding Xre family transcriptional regulator